MGDPGRRGPGCILTAVLSRYRPCASDIHRAAHRCARTHGVGGHHIGVSEEDRSVVLPRKSSRRRCNAMAGASRTRARPRRGKAGRCGTRRGLSAGAAARVLRNGFEPAPGRSLCPRLRRDLGVEFGAPFAHGPEHHDRHDRDATGAEYRSTHGAAGDDQSATVVVSIVLGVAPSILLSDLRAITCREG